MGISDEGFIQDYDLGQKQELFIYCRFCRNTFPVKFKPKSKALRLRCMCGHEAPLAELDVFRTEQAARDHAEFYERVYRAAKDALRDAGLPVPPSQRFRIDDLMESGSSDAVVARGMTDSEDRSDIASSYRELESQEDLTADAIEQGLAQRHQQLLEAGGDVVAYHEVLSELVEWTWCRRHFDARVVEDFLKACRRDIDLAPNLIAEAKARRKRGGEGRLTFTSFKHLVLYYEEEGQLEEALRVCERAVSLGLKSYQKRAEDLRTRIAAGE